MWSTFGFVVLCCLASVLAAPTVHLVKVDESEGVPDYQQLLPTDLPPIVDPVWMTVTMKPLVKTTVVEPLSPQHPQPAEQPVQQDPVTSYQQPIAPSWQSSPQSPSYYPYYYGTPTEGPRPSIPNLGQNPQNQFPYNVVPQYQYHYQSYPQLTWKPVIQPQQQPQLHGPQQPCGGGGVQQAYQQHQYLQRGY